MNNKIYLHPGQKYIFAATQKMIVAICGRGYGKTTIIGLKSYQFINGMPRSRGFFLGLTYTQIITKFLPTILDLWGRIGLKEHISSQEPGHYVVGVKPPDYWQRPYAKVKKFQNIISFYNGSIIELLSMDRKDLNLGGSYDWGAGDEIQGINQDRFRKEYQIAIRGNNYRYKSPLHHSLILTGTMPWLSSGQWILDYEEKAKENSEKILYLERPSFDNKLALGDEYFDTQQAELPAMMYELEIKNKRVKILTNGFYPEFNDQKHTYYASYTYNDELPSIHSLSSYAPKSSDYDPAKPIDISFDFGARVTCMLVGQEINDEFRIIDRFYTTTSQAFLNNTEDDSQLPLQRTVQQFIRVYGNHKAIIYIWGDHTGHNQSDRAVSSYQVVERMLRAAKMLFINNVEKTNNPLHGKKYNIINSILAGKHDRCPKIKINQNKCKELIISIQISPVDNDYKKDKRSERDNTLSIEKQTHFSDCFDYLIYNKYKKYFENDNGTNARVSVGSLS